jgi:hypothetical protein
VHMLLNCTEIRVWRDDLLRKERLIINNKLAYRIIINFTDKSCLRDEGKYEAFRGVLQSVQGNAGIVPRFGHDRFLQNHF